MVNLGGKSNAFGKGINNDPLSQNETSSILAVLIGLETLCVAGCGTSPTLTAEQIDELKSPAFKLFQENKYKEAILLPQKTVRAAGPP